MGKLTGKEVLDKLNELLTNEEEIAYYAKGDAPWRSIKRDIPNEIKEALGEYEEVNQYGGEGQGDNWWTVKYFKDHDVYIKTEGFYSSYNGIGFYYGVGEVVQPKEKTITIYE